MKTAKLLAVAAFAYASLPLLMAQQVDASAHQSTSASASGVRASQSANADGNANVSHGLAGGSASTNASGSASASSGNAVAGTANMRTVTGQLESKLDSKTAKAGDEVVLKTNRTIKTADGVLIPKGSRLIGHVTEVQAHSKQQAESRVGLEFDRVEMRGGQTMAIRSMIESVSSSPAARAAASMENDDAFDTPMGSGAVGAGVGGGGRMGGGLVGGAVGSTAMMTNRAESGLGGATGSAMRATGDVSGTASGNLGSGVSGTASSAGLVGTRATGIQGLMLTGNEVGTTSGMLSAANRNVHLDSGTQMIVGIAAAR